MVMRHFRGPTDSFDGGNSYRAKNMNAPGLSQPGYCLSLLPSIPLLSSDSFVLLISFLAEITRFLDKVQRLEIFMDSLIFCCLVSLVP